MSCHHEFSVTNDVPAYFCDSAILWQRRSNKNTNGPLRKYFPKSTDLSVHSRDPIYVVCAEPNGRQRKTLGGQIPTERLHKLLAALLTQPRVATIPRMGRS